MNWLAELLSSREHNVDTVNVGVVFSLVVMALLTAYATWMDYHTFSALTFSGGAATLLTGAGVGKGYRDSHTPQTKDEPDGISSQPPGQ